jgi:hypothetical protein
VSPADGEPVVEGLTTATAGALVEGKGIVAKATHLVEIVGECLVEGAHRVIGEVVEVGELARDYLLESGRGKLAAEGALIGIPSKVDGEGTPAPVMTGTAPAPATADQATAVAPAASTESLQTPAPAPTTAQ